MLASQSDERKKRYAFIDVQNTETTTLKVLDFEIDHNRLFAYLKDKWKCEKVFFYPGIEYNDANRKKIFDEIVDNGAMVYPKYFSKYKNKDRIIKLTCNKCENKIVYKINNGYSWKSNCDVEMTIDILDSVKKGSEILIFTGDGDFKLLIERAVLCGSKVYIVSSRKKNKSNFQNSASRFSTKLQELIARYPGMVMYIEIDDWKMRIKK